MATAKSNIPVQNKLKEQGQYISPFVTNGDTFRSANKTSLDLTNSQPLGGPINVPNNLHTHTYTPTNTYLDNFGAAASPNSAFGTEGTVGKIFTNVKKGSIFSQTELDIENQEPVGGPNRTNIPNIPGGIYTTAKSGNLYGNDTAPQGGPLKTKEGKDYKVEVQRYNNSSTYLDSLTVGNSDLSSLPTPAQTLISQASGEAKDLMGQAGKAIGGESQQVQNIISKLI